jgi:hypothetical protein
MTSVVWGATTRGSGELPDCDELITNASGSHRSKTAVSLMDQAGAAAKSIDGRRRMSACFCVGDDA